MFEPENVSTLDGPSVHRLPGPRLASITELIADKRSSPELPALRARLAELRQASTATLVARLETLTDALVLWAVHLELDRRGLPPAHRWPANEADEQALYVTWLADLFWFCRRNPRHRAQFRGWQGLFKHTPGSPEWHGAAHRNFLFVLARYSLAHWCSKGLGLTTADRALLMTLPTNQMRADRRTLDPRPFADIEQRLVEAAMQKPDRGMRHPPHAVAARRATMWRTYILAARSYTVGTQVWALTTGEKITRQAFTKQVQAAAHVLADRSNR